MDYLVHHGIKGQKWYIRRYQNPDGSLTEAGKKRYEKQVKREEKRGVKSGIKETVKDVKKTKKSLKRSYRKEKFDPKEFKRSKMEKQISEDNYIKNLNKIEEVGRKRINGILEKTSHLTEKQKRKFRETGHYLVNDWLKTKVKRRFRLGYVLGRHSFF